MLLILAIRFEPKNLRFFQRLFRYHQKLPLEAPILDTKAMHGLAEPEEYAFPKPHELWTPANYNAFNLAKGVDVKDKSVRKTVKTAYLSDTAFIFYFSLYKGLR